VGAVGAVAVVLLLLLLLSLRWPSQVNECLDLVNEITSMRVKLNSRCYSALALVMLRAGRKDMVCAACSSLFSVAVFVCLQPNAVQRECRLAPSWRAGVSMSDTARCMTQAVEAIERGVRQKAPVSVMAYEAVIKFFCRRAEFDTVDRLLRSMATVQCVCVSSVCRAVPCRAVPCRAVPCRAVPCRAVRPCVTSCALRHPCVTRLTPSENLQRYMRRMQLSNGFNYRDPAHLPEAVEIPPVEVDDDRTAKSRAAAAARKRAA
jgi:hypothetical protein